jgi:hypothetical protein
MLLKRALVLLALTLALVACRIGEKDYETITYPLRIAPTTRTCNSPFVAPDMSTLKACGNGLGHCFAGDKTAIPNLPACEGSDVCVPDKVLAANGTKLKACTFLGGKPGACVSLLIQDITAHKDQLQPDVCDKDIERCAPCISPLDGSNTHLCEEAGVHTEACTGGSGAEQASCCHGSGVCMNPDAAPEDQRGSLHHDICPDGKLCAPAALVDGNPTRCHAFGDKGVCIDVCFAAQLAPSGPVMRSVCGPTEICLPCVIGAGQGMPGC